MRHALSIVAAIAITCSAISAAAAPTADEVQQAEDHYVAGVDCYRDGNYAQAAEFFRKSYSLVPKPTLLYNEAYAHALGGDFNRARTVADEALALDLAPELRAKVLARVSAWDVLETSSVDRRPQMFAPPPALKATKLPTPAVSVIEPAPAPKSRRAVPVATWVLGAAGLASLGAWALVEHRLTTVIEELDDAATRRNVNDYDAVLARGRSLQTAGKVTAVTGGVLLVTAGVIWIVHRATGSDSATASTALTWRF